MNRKTQFKLQTYAHYVEMLTHFVRHYVYPNYVALGYKRDLYWHDESLSPITLAVKWYEGCELWGAELKDNDKVYLQVGNPLSKALIRLASELQEDIKNIN